MFTQKIIMLKIFYRSTLLDREKLLFTHNHYTQDVAESYLQKVIDNQSNSINLGGLKLTKFPTLINIGTELDCLIDINLSKNNLFNGDEVLEVRLPILITYLL